MVILHIAILTLIASIIGTISGFGTSTIMIPVLAMFLPPLQVIFLVSIIHWFGDLWKVLLFRKGFDWRLVVSFGIVGLVTSIVGARISLGSNESLLMRSLGGFMMIYACFLAFQSGLKIPRNQVSALTGGALSGFFAGMFGIGGAIRGMFLTSFDLPKSVYIATAGAIGLLVDSTRILTYFFGGSRLSGDLEMGMILFIPISFLGAWLGKLSLAKIPQRRFRQIVSISLLLLGTKLLIYP